MAGLLCKFLSLSGPTFLLVHPPVRLSAFESCTYTCACTCTCIGNPRALGNRARRPQGNTPAVRRRDGRKASRLLAWSPLRKPRRDAKSESHRGGVRCQTPTWDGSLLNPDNVSGSLRRETHSRTTAVWNIEGQALLESNSRGQGVKDIAQYKAATQSRW